VKPLGARSIAHDPVIRRLNALCALDDQAIAALHDELNRTFSVRSRQELLHEGQEILRCMLVVRGWAARTRCVEDGRRRIINVVLPGYLVGYPGLKRGLASSTVVAITDVLLCTAPDSSVSPALAKAYAISRALDEAHLLGQITRLGRLNAQERIQDLLLELLERLELGGLAREGRFTIPLTQEMLADALGLTPVHVNRMLQQARQAGELSWHGGQVVLHDPKAIRRKVGRLKVRVSRPLI